MINLAIKFDTFPGVGTAVETVPNQAAAEARMDALMQRGYRLFVDAWDVRRYRTISVLATADDAISSFSPEPPPRAAAQPPAAPAPAPGPVPAPAPKAAAKAPAVKKAPARRK